MKPFSTCFAARTLQLAAWTFGIQVLVVGIVFHLLAGPGNRRHPEKMARRFQQMITAEMNEIIIKANVTSLQNADSLASYKRTQEVNSILSLNEKHSWYMSHRVAAYRQVANDMADGSSRTQSTIYATEPLRD